MIDEIGTVTGETATVFRWEDDKQDFISKTTNIKKDDGSRATGTPLGKTSAAFAPVSQGRTFLGEARSEEHTSEFQSLMRISYAVFCLKKKQPQISQHSNPQNRHKRP